MKPPASYFLPYVTSWCFFVTYSQDVNNHLFQLKRNSPKLQLQFHNSHTVPEWSSKSVIRKPAPPPPHVQMMNSKRPHEHIRLRTPYQFVKNLFLFFESGVPSRIFPNKKRHVLEMLNDVWFQRCRKPKTMYIINHIKIELRGEFSSKPSDEFKQTLNSL